MKKLKEIRKYVKAQSSLEYDGYKNIEKYFEEFSEGELRFLKINAKTRIALCRETSKYYYVFPLYISMLILILSIIPESLKMQNFIFSFVCVAAFSLLVVLLAYILERVNSSDLSIYLLVLLCVENCENKNKKRMGAIKKKGRGKIKKK